MPGAQETPQLSIVLTHHTMQRRKIIEVGLGVDVCIILAEAFGLHEAGNGDFFEHTLCRDNSKVKEHVSPRLRHPHRPQCATAVAQRCLLHLCRHRLPVGAVCPASSPSGHFASAR